MYTVMTIIHQGLKFHSLLEQCSFVYAYVKVCGMLGIKRHYRHVLCCVVFWDPYTIVVVLYSSWWRFEGHVLSSVDVQLYCPSCN
jgi:hypothetical protein